jgi:hypothetical protein
MSLVTAQSYIIFLLVSSLLMQSFEMLFIHHKNQKEMNFPLKWIHLQKDFSLAPRGIRTFLNWLYTDQFSKLIYFQMLMLLLLMIFPNCVFIVFLILSYFLVCARFRGLFNGGSDCMTMTVLLGLGLSFLGTESSLVSKVGLYYIAFQLTLSYFISGYIKLKNKPWRQGLAFQVILGHSNYSVPSRIRSLALNPIISFCASWLVILWECSFPIVWFYHALVPYYLGIGMLFHLGNFFCFGLNRFFFAWMAAYPALIFCT